MARSLIDALRVLSAVPWFDPATADSLLALVASEAKGDGLPDRMMKEIRTSGVLRHRDDAARVSEPLRSELRAALAFDDQEMYRRAVSIFADHAHNGFSAPLARVLGVHGSRMSVKVATTVANPDDLQAFDDLIDCVYQSDVRSPAHVAADAARLLEAYAYRTDRRTDFLNGLSLWNSGEKVKATLYFERVLEERRLDRPGAIAGHLVGLTRYLEGDLEEALKLLAGATNDLRELNDAKGLGMTLTSLGRVEREFFRTHHSTSHLEDSIGHLEEAVRIDAQEGKTLGRALTALAQSYHAAGRNSEALTAGEQAVELLTVGEDAVAVRTNLALIQRDLGDDDQYRHYLQDAADYAEKHKIDDRQHARLLNMVAASQRKVGAFDKARDNARKSLQLGRMLGDQRHIAHAAHTLAAVYLDSLPEEAEARRRRLHDAANLLNESESILAGLKNSYGIQMVQATLSRLHELETAAGDEF